MAPKKPTFISVDESSMKSGLSARERELLLRMGREVIVCLVKRREVYNLPKELVMCTEKPSSVVVRILQRSKAGTRPLAAASFVSHPKGPCQAVVDSVLIATKRLLKEEPAALSTALSLEINFLLDLTAIERDDRISLPKKIVVGRTGLLVEHGFRRVILLPQVAQERSLDEFGVLAEGCMSLGLLADAWLTEDDLRIHTFEAEAFETDLGRLGTPVKRA